MFEIELAPDAREDLKWFRKSQQQLVLDGLDRYLTDQPQLETRNRKRLRPEHLSEWELRIGAIRVFYDIDAESRLVKVAAIGYKKQNKLFFRGQEYAG
jgi:mRNA-degrading endonuclease RelE of RelBE toxin-antitoxin system